LKHLESKTLQHLLDGKAACNLPINLKTWADRILIFNEAGNSAGTKEAESGLLQSVVPVSKIDMFDNF
jgi:hypothetical protein